MGKKKKKPKSKLETVESIVTILAGISSIGFAIYSILKG
jgi:hypothetical protein